MWGSASSSTQTRGAPPTSTWGALQRSGAVPPGSGNGFDDAYDDEFAALAELGLTHVRLGLDWSRLEPRRGHHDDRAVERMHQILGAATAAGLSVWACLHHFDLPGWFADDEGGFLDGAARGAIWPRHVDWIAETFGGQVTGWMPTNQPMATAAGSWRTGGLSAGLADLDRFAEALESVLLAGNEAWRLLRSGDQPVCTLFDLAPVQPSAPSGDVRERAAAAESAAVVDRLIWRTGVRLIRDGVLSIPGRAEREIPEAAGSFDLVGFTYAGGLGVHADRSVGPWPDGRWVDAVGSAVWPEGLGVTIRRLHDELPGRRLLVAACGLATRAAGGGGPATRAAGGGAAGGGVATRSSAGGGVAGRDAVGGPNPDVDRARYLDDCLAEVADARSDGIDLAGFFVWSAVDGDEWTHQAEVDHGIMDRARRPKPSAAVLSRAALAR